MNRFHLYQYLIVLFSLLALSACEPKEEPITTNEAMALAKQIETTINTGNPGILNTIINEDVFCKRIIEASDNKINRFALNGIKSTVNEVHLGRDIIKAMGHYGTYSLVKQYEKDKKQHLLFRLMGEGNAVNYHDWELVKIKGKITAADLFVYTTGENLSQTMADMATQLIPSDSINKINTNDFEAFASIKKLIQKRNYQDAKKVYDALPVKMKEQKTVMILNIMISSGLKNDSLYKAAMNQFNINYPNQPNIYLIMLEKYFLEKNYEEALNAINNLDKLIDKDPALDFFRSLIYKSQNKETLRKEALERVRKNLPQFAPALLQLAYYYAEENNMTEAATALKEYKNALKPNPEEVEYIYQLYPKLKSDK